MNKRTFLLGAGFSKAVANGPIMSELWDCIVKAYYNEKSKGVSNNRIRWFEELDGFIKSLENEALEGFKKIPPHPYTGGVKGNLEYLFSLIDLHIHGVNFEFKEPGYDIDPYPVIPLSFASQFMLKQIKVTLATYLYIILEGLKNTSEINNFISYINENDSIITFNYDIVLEKALWESYLWSPLDGYIGVTRFKNQKDGNKLEEAGRISKIKIHKMHGSISWANLNHFSENGPIGIDVENKERCEFHFNGMDKILDREPINLQIDEHRGYIGAYEPPWIMPSFMKPFNRREFFEIWKSAIKTLNKTKELILIGYSFRPEDSNAQLLLANIPNSCKVIIVDKYDEIISQRLKSMGIKIYKSYSSINSLVNYL